STRSRWAATCPRCRWHWRSPGTSRPRWRRSSMPRASASELTVPTVSVAGGLLYLVVGLIGGQVWFGITGLVIMVVFAAVLWRVRHRSETVAGLLNRRDERINAIDLTATAYAGGALVVALVIGF